MSYVLQWSTMPDLSIDSVHDFKSANLTLIVCNMVLVSLYLLESHNKKELKQVVSKRLVMRRKQLLIGKTSHACHAGCKHFTMISHAK